MRRAPTESEKNERTRVGDAWRRQIARLGKAPLRKIARRWAWAVLLACVVLWSGPAASGQSLTVVAPPDVLRDYHAFLHGRDPLAITEYSGPYSRRDVVECVLFLQALSLGGLSERLTVAAIPSYSRIALELKSGAAVAGATSFWREDLAALREDVFISPPLIRDGEFEAGLYTAPGNRRALAAVGLRDVRRLSGVCNRQWRPDWALMTGLGLAQLTNAASWEVMVRMTAEGRADFLLAPFQPTPGLRLDAFGLTLTPIPGLKVRLPGSRHFGVSRRNPAGERLFRALVRGLERMRAAHTIERAYAECGFFNSAVRDWKALDPPSSVRSGR